MSLRGGVALPPRFSVTHELRPTTDSVAISVKYTTSMNGNITMESLIDDGQEAIDNMIKELMSGLVHSICLEMQALEEGA